MLQLDPRKVRDTGKAVVVEFERKKNFLDMMLRMLKRLLAFTFVRIIFG
jgi:hypothetical protein